VEIAPSAPTLDFETGTLGVSLSTYRQVLDKVER